MLRADASQGRPDLSNQNGLTSRFSRRELFNRFAGIAAGITTLDVFLAACGGGETRGVTPVPTRLHENLLNMPRLQHNVLKPAAEPYFGLAVMNTDFTSISAVEAQIGNYLLEDTYVDLAGGQAALDTVKVALEAIVERNAVPILAVQVSPNNPDGTQVPSLLAGQYDFQLIKLAKIINELKYPDGSLAHVGVRPNHEMNENFYNWGRDPNHPQVYINGFKYIINGLEYSGATNISSIFSPNVINGQEKNRLNDFTIYMTGLGSYFDLFGLDGYNYAGQPGQSMGSVFSSTIDRINQHGEFSAKPILITETGTDGDPVFQANWVSTGDEAMRARLGKRYMGIVYYDQNANRNWQIDLTNAQARTILRSVVNRSGKNINLGPMS